MRMLPPFGKLITFGLAHKFISTIVLVVFFGGGYWAYGALTSTSAETRYVLGTVSKGTIVSTISASGKVSASDQTDVKAKVSGDITWVGVKAGTHVSSGQALATIENIDAQQAVTDAQLAVEQAQLTLDQNRLQAPLDYQTTKDNVEKAKRDLASAYEDTFVALSDAFIKLPDVMTGADDILYDFDLSNNIQNIGAYSNLFISADSTTQSTIKKFTNRAEEDYVTARASYDVNALAFKQLTRSSSASSLESSLSDTRTMAGLISQAVGSETNMIDTVVDQLNLLNQAVNSAVTSAQSSSRANLSTANSVFSSLTSAQKSLQSAKDAVTSAENDLAIASLGNPDGTQPFDLKLQQNTLAQKQAALANAKQTLADYTIRAPYSGTLASFDIKRGDSVSNGTVAGTIITNQRIAELSLNEVDAVKVQVGDKATLTFDAIEDLTLTGEVAEIDTLGSVSQGVVSYTIKIAFDTQDSRVRPSMTVNAAIQTDVKQDVLTVPSSAVKTQGGVSYVQVFQPALTAAGDPQGVTSSVAPQQVEVVIGISDDTNVEIVSGLDEGGQIVVRTISGTATVVTTPSSGGSRNSGFGGPSIRL